MTSVAGCDCGKGKLHVCLMETKPANLKQFVRSYDPIILKSDRTGIEELIALPVKVYAIEPTGHYSRIWIDALKRAGKEVKLVSSRRIRHYREYHGCLNKADRPDAAAIAAFTLENLDHPEAFLKGDREVIRDYYYQLCSTTRAKNPIFNRLGQRLSFEYPEAIKTYEGDDREWLEEDPPAIIRFLAGIGMKRQQAKREKELDNTIGEGLSIISRRMAAQLAEFERQEFYLETLLQEQLNLPQFERYHAVFDRFKIPPRTRCALLSTIYPFEDFLRDGKPVIEYIRGELSKRKSQLTKRDRSEGEFKLSLGMGKVLVQSGGKWEWKAGGSKIARTALYCYIDRLVKVGKGKGFEENILDPLLKTLKTDDSPWLNPELINAVAEVQGIPVHLAALRIHYQCQPTKADKRMSATAGRFARMLYKELLKEFSR